MNVNALARRWERGWEIWIDDEAVTQVTALADAASQVRDYLDTIDPAVDHSGWDIVVTPELGPLSDRVREARQSTATAALAQERAAKSSREVARELREAGLSLADAAAVLGVSRGRVSQLVSASNAATATPRVP